MISLPAFNVAAVNISSIEVPLASPGVMSGRQEISFCGRFYNASVLSLRMWKTALQKLYFIIKGRFLQQPVLKF